MNQTDAQTADLQKPPRRTRRHRRADRLREQTLSPVRILMRVIAVPAVAAVVAMSVYIRTSPYEPTEALMHLIARSSCSAARSVGLAPSFRGELGYHARNDADGDGVACEWPGINVPGAANAAEAVPAAAPGRMAGGAKFVRPGQ